MNLIPFEEFKALTNYCRLHTCELCGYKSLMLSNKKCLEQKKCLFRVCCTSLKPAYDIILDDRAVNYADEDTERVLTKIYEAIDRMSQRKVKRSK